MFLAGNTHGFYHHRYTDTKAKPCSVTISGVHSVYLQGQEGQHGWRLIGVNEARVYLQFIVKPERGLFGSLQGNRGQEEVKARLRTIGSMTELQRR